MGREGAAKVLIVDDEPTNVRVLAEAIGPGFDVRFATSAPRALEIATTETPDLILLDVVMPGLDGYEVLRRLKEGDTTRDTPVIFVTARDEAQDEALGFELGAVDYIHKPVNPLIVRARVRTHVELKRQRDQLASLAAQDGLTGIANRRRLDETFELRWRSAQRNGAPLSLLLLDVDYFKLFNDRYGHGAGDECLRGVARALAGAFGRADDLPARYGGEEFAVLLAEAGGLPDQALRLLQAVRALGVPHAASTVAPHLTVSVGAATLTPSRDEGPEALLELADKLLYEAKRGGRDRCVCADPATGERQVVRLPDAAGYRP